ncbi:adenosine receptor A3-like [Pleurodeles waltl]|uniref:adenosine receptor A3-like n=1 Tax=Pleurodeles waltl TaxID=8319 RepID=UPI00370993F2
MANNTTTDRPYKGVYIAVETIIAALAVLGNALVIGAVKRNRGLRNVTFCCLVSLAIADMAVGLVVIPLSILVDSGLQTNFYSCLFMCCNLIIFTNASILSLLAIAIDRYLRIKIPTRYKTLTTKKNIWFCLLVCWLVSFVLGLVPMFGWNKKATEQANNSFIQCSFTTVMRMDYMVFFNFFGCVLLPLLLISGLYLQIFYLLRKHLKQNRTSRSGGTFYGREYKTAKSLALVLFLFALCWLPLSFTNSLLFFWPHICQGNAYISALYCSILLSHAHSAMNPVVYAFRIQKFRETYKDIVCKRVFRRVGEPMSFSEENSLDPIS